MVQTLIGVAIATIYVLVVFLYEKRNKSNVYKVLAYLFIAKYVNNFLLAMILAITAGIMIHISSYELLPSSFSYKKPTLTLISFICGFLVMLICDFIF